MIISKGQPWERRADSDDIGAPVASDWAGAWLALECLESSRAKLRLPPGDLLKTLGYETSPDPAVGLEFAMDLGMASLDGNDSVPFASHLVARRRFWSGEWLVAMNAAWLGDLYLGPKAHPNDGLLDVTFGRLEVGQRLLAAKRARLGTHLPHPELDTRRVGTLRHDFANPVTVYADGNRIGQTRMLTLKVIPDAFFVIV